MRMRRSLTICAIAFLVVIAAVVLVSNQDTTRVLAPSPASVPPTAPTEPTRELPPPPPPRESVPPPTPLAPAPILIGEGVVFPLPQEFVGLGVSDEGVIRCRMNPGFLFLVLRWNVPAGTMVFVPLYGQVLHSRMEGREEEEFFFSRDDDNGDGFLQVEVDARFAEFHIEQFEMGVPFATVSGEVVVTFAVAEKNKEQLELWLKVLTGSGK